MTSFLFLNFNYCDLKINIFFYFVLEKGRGQRVCDTSNGEGSPGYSTRGCYDCLPHGPPPTRKCQTGTREQRGLDWYPGIDFTLTCLFNFFLWDLN